MAHDPHPLWRFSLDVYRRAGVQEACLALQERHGVDVNVLMLCCWAASPGARSLGAAELRECMQRAERMQETVVKPLRTVRRSLKGGIPGVGEDAAKELRQAVLRVELEAENIEQALLMQALPALAQDGTPRREIALESLERYLELLGVSPDAETHRHLATLVGAALPNPGDPDPPGP